jgi:NAD(P)H-dependent FMN reductase
MHGNPYLVLASSTRPIRRSPTIAAWVAALGDTLSDARFEVVDLKDLRLAFDDEPHLPAAGLGYVSNATRAWSERVSASRGVVFVTPQYNWGYPAALKNAIDHLYAEWTHKPGLIVTYGSRGGGLCAAQLRQVLTGLDMRLAEAMPALPIGRARVEANDGEIEPEVDFAAHRDGVLDALGELLALTPAA